ncbi:MAG: serine O-acetyltransferase EpsC [Alkalispirochaetaceae bacterium]
MADELFGIASAITRSYEEIGGINHLDGPNLPSRPSIVKIMTDLQSLIFPGYQSEDTVTKDSVSYVVSEKTSRLLNSLSREIFKSLCYKESVCREGRPLDECREEAKSLALDLLRQIPEIRRRVKLDVEAAFAGDPAAQSKEEIILAYPGVEAIIVHRIAHEIWAREIPLIPRIMSEVIHGKTGIDIHPGAQIGNYFFIDHATGVVIGETTVIGDHVKIYQGVTLGALSVKKSEANTKRHPTIEDNVTIYAGATILGGKTVIGHDSIVGGNVWLTESIAPGSRIYTKAGEFNLRRGRSISSTDYQI